MRADDPKIDDLIKRTQFHRFPGTQITVCAISLHNGQQAVGYSIGPDHEGYDQEEGERQALFVCRRRIAGLETYVERRKRSDV